MSKHHAHHRKKTKRKRSRKSASLHKTNATDQNKTHPLFSQAQKLAERGQYKEASQIYDQLMDKPIGSQLAAKVQNDRAVLAAIDGDFQTARQEFLAALELNPGYALAKQNLGLLPDAAGDHRSTTEMTEPPPAEVRAASRSATRIAIVSFLFNWPTGGGGNVHTLELARFLAEAGYNVRHFYPKYPPWQIGHVEQISIDSHGLDFTEPEWRLDTIKRRFRQVVDDFEPDYVFITDSWNFKPHLADAFSGYPVVLRFQALECLCPLNNVRLLMEDGNWKQCHLHQLAQPSQCGDCLAKRGTSSGSLHRDERALAQVGSAAYHELLLRVLAEAEAVLVLNPFTEAMISPYARRVVVAPWGMDPARFPPPETTPTNQLPLTIFQAGVISEPMKGFAVLHEACRKLRQSRLDFELVATGMPPGRVDDFTRFTGWRSQQELPDLYRQADIVAVPTVAQEGLSRTSVEAMACAKPVVASRIGGLPSTVTDGLTGLLCEPGNSDELSRKLALLLDDRDLRQRLGAAGRKRFEEDFAWNKVIDRHYRPLFAGKVNRNM